MDLVTAPTLVVSQRAKLIELNNQYEIRASDGSPLGYVEQEGQSTRRKVLRFVSDLDQFLTHQLSLRDATGHELLQLTRPAKLFRSRLLVTDGTGRRVGEIVQRNVIGRIQFDLLGAQQQRLGRLKAENWRAWDFSIVDASDVEVARIDKRFVGVVRAAFTTADDYVVDIDPAVTGDLRLLVLACATAVDTALKQDARGVDITDALDVL